MEKLWNDWRNQATHNHDRDALPNSLLIVIATSGVRAAIHRPSCAPLAALSHIVKGAQLNWFPLVVSSFKFSEEGHEYQRHRQQHH